MRYSFFLKTSLLILSFVSISVSKTQEEKDADEAEKSTPILKKELASVDTKVKEYTNLVNDHTGKTVVVNKLEDSKKSANDLVTQGITLKQTAVDLRRKAEDKLFLAEIAETAAVAAEKKAKTVKNDEDEKIAKAAANKASTATTGYREIIRSSKVAAKSIQDDIDKARKSFYSADLLSANKDEVVQKIDKDAIDLDEKIKQLVKDAEKTHTEAKEAEKLAQNSVVTTKAEAEAAFLKSVNAEKEARKLFRLAEDLNSHINVIKVAADNAKTDPAIGTKADASVKRVAASIVEIEPVLKESDKTTLPNLLNALEAAKNGKLEAHKRIAPFLIREKEAMAQQHAIIINNQQIEDLNRAADQEYILTMQQVEKEKAELELQKQVIDQEEQKRPESVRPQENEKVIQQKSVLLNENNQPLNVDHYNDEVYAQAAQGDLDTDCLNRLSECGNGLIDVNCAGTCQRELSGQDHGQNCGPMSDLCSNLAYQDIIKLYCRGTCT